MTDQLSLLRSGARVFCLTAVLLPQIGTAETIVSVANATELRAAIVSAQPGTTIELAAGDYGYLDMEGTSGAENSPITVRSSDPERMASIAGLDLRQGKDLVFQNLKFDYVFNFGDPQNARPFQVFASRAITFRGNQFDGDLEPGVTEDETGFPTAFGLSIRASTNIEVVANDIHGFITGVAVTESTDLDLIGNEISQIRSDGLSLSQVERVLIQGNSIHDFSRLEDATSHSDMIRFWTNGTSRPTRDVTISNNILDSGHGTYTQSIFMRNDLVDRGLAGPEMFYRNILIEGNVIINSHMHGITVGETVGLAILNNTLVQNPLSIEIPSDADRWVPKIRVADRSDKVEISRNIVPGILGYLDQVDWRVEENTLIQNQFPNDENFYDDVFVAARIGNPSEVRNFTYLSETDFAQTNMGSRLLDRIELDQGVLVPLIRVVSLPSSKPLEVILDAEKSYLPEGVSIESVHANWKVDGVDVGAGTTLTYQFPEAQTYRVGLDLIMPDGTQKSVESDVVVQGEVVLAFDPATAQFFSYVEDNGGLVEGILGANGELEFGGSVAPILIEPEKIRPFFDADRFRIDMRIRGLGSFREFGEVLRVHPSLIAGITGRGTVEVAFLTQDQRVVVRSRPIRIFDGQTVDLSIDYSSDRGTLQIIANSEVIGESNIHGRTFTEESWGIGFGAHLRNRPGFHGAFSEFSLSAPSQAGTASPD